MLPSSSHTATSPCEVMDGLADRVGGGIISSSGHTSTHFHELLLPSSSSYSSPTAGGIHFRKRHILFSHPPPLPPLPPWNVSPCSDGCPAWCCFNIKHKNVLFGRRAHRAPAEGARMQTGVRQRSTHRGFEGPGAELTGENILYSPGCSLVRIQLCSYFPPRSRNLASVVMTSPDVHLTPSSPSFPSSCTPLWISEHYN